MHQERNAQYWIALMVFVHHSLFISLPEEILHPESHFVPVAARNHSIIISNCNILGQAQNEDQVVAIIRARLE
jgi:hypothetical protein